jgi:hypothetical protein
LPPGFTPPNPFEELKMQMKTLKAIQERKKKFKEVKTAVAPEPVKL